MATLALGGRFYQSDSLPISAQECVNLYANVPQTESPTDINLFITPGLTQATTAGGNIANRGSHNFQDEPYFVQGNDLFRIDRSIDAFGVTTYSSVEVDGGTDLPGTGRVMMADNGAEGDQMVIILPDQTNQFNAYIFTKATNTLVQISDGDFDGPVSSVRYIDGFFLFTKSNGQKFFNSLLRNGLSYIATDFLAAESDPDSIVAGFILNNEPYMFGTITVEGFQNVGGSGFPFQRIQGAVHRKGLSSAFAIEQVNDIMIWLGAGEKETPVIWRSNGGKPEKVSTTAIDNAIAKFSDTTISTCFTWKYSQSGAQFVGFTFPDEKTFVYDFITNEWATRESLDVIEQIIPYRVSSIVDVFGVLMVGDSLSNRIGILDKKSFTEYGEEVRRRFVTPQLDNDGQPFFIDALELWGDAGIGLTSGQGSDPQVLMSFSRDGGRTFNNTLSRGMGKIGEYETRTIWNTLGRIGRQICFKFEVSDPVKWVFSKVEAELE